MSSPSQPVAAAVCKILTISALISLLFIAGCGTSASAPPAIAVALSPTGPVSLDQGGTVLITATVSNDSTAAGVSWTLSSGLGTLSGQTSTTTVTYNAPSSFTVASTAVVTATSKTDSTKMATFTINLIPPPQITTTSMPAGTASVAYSSSVSMTGGVAPYAWSLVAGPAGISLASSTTSTVTAQGTPTTAGANQTFTIKVTDAQGLSATSSGLTITILPLPGSLSGTVTGPVVSGVTITLSGAGTGSTTTNSGGAYSFTGLAGGTYTVTPSLAGYSFNPSAPSVTLSTTTVQNFTETSTTPSFSISGTVTYSGSQTGNTIIRVFYNCLGCGVVGGTSFTVAPSSTGTSYIVRGLPATNSGGGASSYIVEAEIDTLGKGIPNESNPEGATGQLTVSANVTGANVTVSDRTPPSKPSTPSQFSVSAANKGAVVQYQAAPDGNGEEIATSYNVYYGTDTNASNGASSPVNFKAQGSNTDVLILKNIPNGLTYFKLTAVNSQGESAATTPVSATLGAGSGANTISGTVTFPGTATGPMYVGLYYGNGIYSQAIQNPVSPQAYTISDVPAGTYTNFAIIDMNNDGEIDAGDIEDVSDHSNAQPTLVVSGNVTNANLTLTNLAATTYVMTNVNGQSGQPDSYNIQLFIVSGTKLPISMTLLSGPNVAVPYDMNADQHNSNYNPVFSGVPSVGDTYQLLVTFSDGTTQTIPASVAAVLTSSFAQNLVMQTTSPGSPTIPLLTWSAPATIPAITPYYYDVGLYSTSGTEQWYYSGGSNSNGIPSTQTNVLFNYDGSASPNATLTVGATYNWYVQVQDGDGNSAQYTTTYTVP